MTDTQLKQTLAKMLPEVIDTEWTDMDSTEPQFLGLIWRSIPGWPDVQDTELLHLCWLVEVTLGYEIGSYQLELADYSYYSFHATWQQRVVALAKVKGIEIL